jgi:hypothetical protein
MTDAAEEALDAIEEREYLQALHAHSHMHSPQDLGGPSHSTPFPQMAHSSSQHYDAPHHHTPNFGPIGHHLTVPQTGRTNSFDGGRSAKSVHF